MRMAQWSDLIERKERQLSLDVPGETILDISWGGGHERLVRRHDHPTRVGVLTLDRCDVWRVLIWIMFGWLALAALLLGYRGEHL